MLINKKNTNVNNILETVALQMLWIQSQSFCVKNLVNISAKESLLIAKNIHPTLLQANE